MPEKARPSSPFLYSVGTYLKPRPKKSEKWHQFEIPEDRRPEIVTVYTCKIGLRCLDATSKIGLMFVFCLGMTMVGRRTMGAFSAGISGVQHIFQL